jgi:hypothetical protein
MHLANLKGRKTVKLLQPQPRIKAFEIVAEKFKTF